MILLSMVGGISMMESLMWKVAIPQSEVNGEDFSYLDRWDTLRLIR